MKAHRDRLATTLAQRDQLPDEPREGLLPGAGSADARVDLKLLLHRVREALEQRGTAAAKAHIERIQSPDLLSGTVQDGTARGVMVVLEEAASLCEPEKPPRESFDGGAKISVGKDLRRRHDLLVASAGARLRFSRKRGILLVDRAHDLHLEDCIRFEDRTDTGTLDGFSPAEGERPRIFSPAFLTPARHEQGPMRDLLVLEGRLGRRGNGFPCRLELEGRKDEKRVRMRVRIENRLLDHRLRIRFLGFADQANLAHAGTPAWEVVRHHGGHFLAATLVRACGTLLVGGERVPVPQAQCPGWIEHHFRLGG